MFLSSIPPEYKRSNLTGKKSQAKQHYLQDDIELLLQNLIFILGLAKSCKAPEKSEKAFKMTERMVSRIPASSWISESTIEVEKRGWTAENVAVQEVFQLAHYPSQERTRENPDKIKTLGKS